MSTIPDWNTLPGIPKSRGSGRKPVIVGHRGARGLAPENTLAAFRVAADLRVDGVEFDVQRTRDGHLIVIHDETVDRTTDGTGDVAAFTLDEIKRLDAGAKFAPEFAGEPVPTLGEVFDLLEPTGLLFFVEIKDPSRYPGIEQQIADLIRAYGLVDRVQVRSFEHPSLHLLYGLAPEIPISELWYERIPAKNETRFKTINVLYSLYTPENLVQIHQRGQQATAWTVNDLDAARRLMAAGIDGLTTDYPDRLLTLFNE